MKGPNLQEISKANLQPLNRISKVWLERAGVEPDPGNLHALALIQWALGENAIKVEIPGDPLLTGKTEARLAEMGTKWRPEKSMEFLTTGLKAYGPIDPEDLEQAGSPVDAALMLLDGVRNAIANTRH